MLTVFTYRNKTKLKGSVIIKGKNAALEIVYLQIQVSIFCDSTENNLTSINNLVFDESFLIGLDGNKTMLFSSHDQLF